LINSYFDFDDYENPVKSYYEDLSFYDLVPAFQNSRSVKIKSNQYSSDNSIFYKGFPETGTFYSIGSNTYELGNYNSSNGNLFSLGITLSQEYDFYERSVFSFSDMFAVLGGVYEIYTIAGGLLVYNFTDKLFYTSLLSSLYQVKSNDFSNKKKQKLSTIGPSFKRNETFTKNNVNGPHEEI
jgi:hypothetical protein